MPRRAGADQRLLAPQRHCLRLGHMLPDRLIEHRPDASVVSRRERQCLLNRPLLPQLD